MEYHGPLYGDMANRKIMGQDQNLSFRLIWLKMYKREPKAWFACKAQAVVVVHVGFLSAPSWPCRKQVNRSRKKHVPGRAAKGSAKVVFNVNCLSTSKLCFDQLVNFCRSVFFMLQSLADLFHEWFFFMAYSTAYGLWKNLLQPSWQPWPILWGVGERHTKRICGRWAIDFKHHLWLVARRILLMSAYILHYIHIFQWPSMTLALVLKLCPWPEGAFAQATMPARVGSREELHGCKPPKLQTTKQLRQQVWGPTSNTGTLGDSWHVLKSEKWLWFMMFMMIMMVHVYLLVDVGLKTRWHLIQSRLTSARMEEIGKAARVHLRHIWEGLMG